MLKVLFASNSSMKNYQNAVDKDGQGNCIIEPTNGTSDSVKGTYLLLDLIEMGDFPSIELETPGKKFYAYVTPFIICLGLLGNFASLSVFLSKRLRRLSASLYLAALSASDSVVLLTYVLLAWILQGLKEWPGGHRVAIINMNGLCHLFLFISYTFRFVSVYLILVFTIERYIAVCRPLHRRMICTKHFARMLILFVHVLGVCVSLYKPILSGVYDVEKSKTGIPTSNNGSHNSQRQLVTVIPGTTVKACMRNPKYDDVNFVMELVYGLLITVVPFAIMTVFNLLIIRKLIMRFSENSKLQMSFRENKIRWEFTIMLLSVSSCFICLNMPHFIVWVQHFKNSLEVRDPLYSQKLSNQLYITRTIFNINYCVNFLVYCLTGSYYRNVIKDWMDCGRKSKRKQISFNNGYLAVQRKPSHSMSLSTQSTFV